MDFSDDDEELNVPQVKRAIVYGSLEEKEKLRLAANSSSGSLASDAIKAGKAAGNINITEGGSYDIAERDPNEGQEELIAELEKRKKARQIQVSTDDSEVKVNLRQLGEPICLFGEGPAERRERLRRTLAELGSEATGAILRKGEESSEKKKEEENVTWQVV